VLEHFSAIGGLPFLLSPEQPSEETLRNCPKSLGGAHNVSLRAAGNSSLARFRLLYIGQIHGASVARTTFQIVSRSRVLRRSVPLMATSILLLSVLLEHAAYTYKMDV
jgi:hypothetical protein